MTRAEKIEAYLKENDIEYFKGENGCVCVDINKIPVYKFKAYHNFMYTVQEGEQNLN